MDAYRILSAPKAFKATKGFIGKSIPMEMVPAMIATAKQIRSSVSSWESDYYLDTFYKRSAYAAPFSYLKFIS